MEFTVNMPVKIFSGTDSLLELPVFLKNFGIKGLLISFKELHAQIDQLDLALKTSNIQMTKFFLENPEPTTEFIDKTALDFSSQKFDFIIGLGGGSAIDMAKSLSIALTNQDDIWNYANLSNRSPKPIDNEGIPVIAIPTTSGTGSEVTPYAVLSKEDTKQKGTIQDPKIFPVAAFIEPKLMISMPKELTISTALDAFSHSLESFINISKYSPISEITSIEALKIIFNNLPLVLKDPENLELRMNLAWASTLSGISISHRGTTTIHAIAEPLGALTHLPHAHCVSISILPVLKVSIEHSFEKFALLYEKIFPNDTFDNRYDLANSLYQKIENLIIEVEMNRTLEYYIKLDNKEKFIEKLQENIFRYKFRPLKQHPVQFSEGMIKQTLSKIV